MTAVLTERQSIKESVTNLSKRPNVALFIRADWNRNDTASSNDQIIREANKLANSLGRVSTARMYTSGSSVRNFDNIEILVSNKNRTRSEHTFILDVYEHSSQAESADVYVLMLAQATTVHELVSRLVSKNKTVVVVSSTDSAREFPRSWPMLLVPLNKFLSDAQSEPPAKEGVDVSSFDFKRFITLLEDTQDRLDFVGVKYFINKVMWRLDISTPRQCQDVFQAAQERGIIEIFEQENIKEGGQPVSACRLNSEHSLVQQAIAAQTEESKVLTTEDVQPEGTKTSPTSKAPVAEVSAQAAP